MKLAVVIVACVAVLSACGASTGGSCRASDQAACTCNGSGTRYCNEGQWSPCYTAGAGADCVVCSDSNGAPHNYYCVGFGTCQRRSLGGYVCAAQGTPQGEIDACREGYAPYCE